MKTPRRKLWPVLVALTVVLAIAFVAVPAMAATGGHGQDKAKGAVQPHGTRVAATAQSQVQRQVIVEVGDPVVVGPHERVQTVVSIGGDVTIAGTVDESVIVIGGDVLLQATADVGGRMKNQDATMVIVNGELTRQTGAQVQGNIETIDIGNIGDVWEWASENGGWAAFRPIGSFIGWLVGTVVFLLLGLLAAAIMPGQIRAVERQVARRPGASLGWGALTVLLIVPLSIILLMITIIGIIPAVGVILVLPFFTIFVVTAVATFVVERLLGAQLKGNLMGAVAIASVATSTVVQIPFLGFLVLVAMTFIGTGAALIAWSQWRQGRRALREGGAPAGGPGGAPVGVGPGAGPGGHPQGAPAVPPAAPYAAPAPEPASWQPPYAQQPGGQPPYVPAQGAQPPYVPPQSAQPTYAQQTYAQSPYAPPPIAQAPVGTQAYLHPQYGWVVYGPPPEAQTAIQPPVVEPQTQVTEPQTQVTEPETPVEEPAPPALESETGAAVPGTPGEGAGEAADDAGADEVPHDEVK